MDNWRTAIATSDEKNIWIRGYDVTALMTRVGFTETIFLLHQGRLPSADETRLLDAVLVGVADHGSGARSCAAATGNRQSLSAAVAAGILAIGDEHGGAGSACMELIGSRE
jgi:citrate synthase